ncbi:MAG: formimidoylglutamase [Cytophagaceae bacterium]
MNLRIFFDPVKEITNIDPNDPGAFANNIQINNDKFPDWQNADLALIGIKENRGSKSNISLENGPDMVRKHLYNLRKGTGNYKIADLGNLRNGISLEETHLRLKEVCEILLQHDIMPIIIGGAHDMDLGQFLGYQNTGKYLNFLNIDAFVDMQGSSGDMSKHHIHKILVHEPNYIFHYCQLGYQSFLTDQETINVLEKLHFETHRLGSLRENLSEFEPVIRNADLISFDITAIRQSDAPGNSNSQPFGLTGEEACQICWYAGLSSNLTSFGIYEYNPEQDIKGQTAGVIATMIWYLIEGYYSRIEELNVQGPDYTKYIVSMPQDPHKMTFYKHVKSEKWWLEVPYPSDKTKFARNSIVPCSYNDYQLANKGEIPNRWILTHSKLI